MGLLVCSSMEGKEIKRAARKIRVEGIRKHVDSQQSEPHGKDIGKLYDTHRQQYTVKPAPYLRCMPVQIRDLKNENVSLTR